MAAPTYCLTVSLLLRAGAEAAAETHLRALAEHSRREPGCLAYNVHRAHADARRILIYELYRDAAALQAHAAAPHFATHALGGLYTLIETREAQAYEAVDALPRE